MSKNSREQDVESKRIIINQAVRALELLGHGMEEKELNTFKFFLEDGLSEHWKSIGLGRK